MKKTSLVGACLLLGVTAAFAQSSETEIRVRRTVQTTDHPMRDHDMRHMRMHRRYRQDDGDNIRVLVNGDPVRFPDQQPMMDGDRVTVPLRGVFAHLGADVMWDQDRNIVVARSGGHRIMLPIGQTEARVDGQTIHLDQPAQVVNGRAMVPLRFLSESLGATVDWRSSTNTVDIKK